MTRHWIRYTCGAVGLSVCSLWIVRHSRLVGSPDIDNWIREAKDSTITFWTDHVEQPVWLWCWFFFSKRNQLFRLANNLDSGHCFMSIKEVMQHKMWIRLLKCDDEFSHHCFCHWHWADEILLHYGYSCWAAMLPKCQPCNMKGFISCRLLLHKSLCLCSRLLELSNPKPSRFYPSSLVSVCTISQPYLSFFYPS